MFTEYSLRVISGDIEVTVAGVQAALLSATEAALLADTLWEIGTSTQTKGAITISAALKSAANTSILGGKVDMRSGDLPALQEALNDMQSDRPKQSGLTDLNAAI